MFKILPYGLPLFLPKSVSKSLSKFPCLSLLLRLAELDCLEGVKLLLPKGPFPNLR